MTLKQPKPKLNRQILDEASDWFVEFRVGDIDSGARERFDLWLRQSPQHIRAYMEIASTYVALPALNPNRKVDVKELIAYARSEGNVVPFDHTARPNQRGEGNSLSPRDPRAATELKGERPRTWLSRRIAVAAAAVLLAATAAATWFVTQRNTYTTDIGERRSITLSDGSTIDLNARSKVRIKFSQGERDVELLEGQALFAVTHDVSRPFNVFAGNTIVRAVGTQFDVYRKRSGTTVTVVEGRVAVFTYDSRPSTSLPPSSADTAGQELKYRSQAEGGPPGRMRITNSSPSIPRRRLDMVDPRPNPSASEGEGATASLRSPSDGEATHRAGEVFVSAGEQVTVTEREVAEPKLTNIAATTAWTQHRLIFDGTPLGDVVDDFNRYNTRQLVIEDRVLDDFHVSGVYSSTDPASLIRFLRQQPGIDVLETDERVRITRK